MEDKSFRQVYDFSRIRLTPQLDVRLHAQVMKVLMQDNCMVGTRFLCHGLFNVAHTVLETNLSAGALGLPLLQIFPVIGTTSNSTKFFPFTICRE